MQQQNGLISGFRNQRNVHPPPIDFFMWQRMVDIELVTAYTTLTGYSREVQHQLQITIQWNSKKMNTFFVVIKTVDSWSSQK